MILRHCTPSGNLDLDQNMWPRKYQCWFYISYTKFKQAQTLSQEKFSHCVESLMIIINQELFNLLTAWHLTSDKTRSGKLYHLLTKLLMKMLTKSMLSIYLWWGLIIRGLARPSEWQFSPAQMISLIISHGRRPDACKQGSSAPAQPVLELVIKLTARLNVFYMTKSSHFILLTKISWRSLSISIEIF